MKLKILCIHGHHQNALKFREKTGSLRKALQSLSEFVFIDSPIQEGASKDEEPSEDHQTWFTTTDENVYKRDFETNKFNRTFEESSKFVRHFIGLNGPFDGILCFSQGAAFIHALIQQEQVSTLKFVIFCCGFICRNAAPHVNAEKITGLPTFHCINQNDQVIPNSLSEELASVFDEPISVVKEYECGHCIPPIKLCKSDFVEFLTEFLPS